MLQQNKPALVHIMAFRLFGTKPLSAPMLTNCQLDSLKQTSMKFESTYNIFHWRKSITKCHLPNGGDVVSAKLKIHNLLLDLSIIDITISHSTRHVFTGAADFCMNYVRNELVESSYTTTLYDSNIVSNPLSWESVLDWLKSKVSTLNIYIYIYYIYISLKC